MIECIKKELKTINNDKIQLYLFGVYLLLIYIFEENGTMLKISSLLLLSFCIIEFINIVRIRKISFNISIVFIFLFAFFCGLSIFWSLDKGLSIEKTKTMFLLAVFILFSFNYFNRVQNSALKVTNVLAIVGIIFAVYILCYYGPISYFKQLFMGERIGREIENVNSIGIKMSVTFVICTFNAMFLKNKKYLFLSALPLIISIGTGSRKAILFIIISLIILTIYFLRDSNINKKKLKKIFGAIFLVIAIIIILIQFIEIPFISTQMNRMKGMINGVLGSGKADHATSLRMSYIDAGIAQFKKTPIFGIGIDNARIINTDYTYLHNNFVELLTSVGIIGFVLYYATYFIILFNFIKNIKKLNGHQIVAFALFSSLFIIEYGMVSYYTKNTYIYILLCYLTIDLNVYQYDLSKIINVVKSPKIILIKMLNIGFFNWMNDEQFLKLKYRLIFNKQLDLNNPKSFNEKLQWLKLHDHNDLYVRLVDKYLVKKYVEKNVGAKYVIPTIAVYSSFDEIDFDSLPNQFVIKCNHDSGGLVLCSDKKKFNKKMAAKIINSSIRKNYYYFSREWPYKNVEKKIIIEKFMSDNNSDFLIDYKVMCFNGKAKYIFTCTDRFNGSGLKVTFFDTKWKKMPFTRHYPASTEMIEKPYNLKKMIELSEKLSKKIPFVRVDWYEINKELFFGEMTFYPGSGFEEFTPDEWDYKLGELIDISTNVRR